MPTSFAKTVRTNRLLLACLSSFMLLTMWGCRTSRDNQIDILERELRSQEDYIYELEDYVVEYSEKLRECRCTIPHKTIHYTQPKKPKSSSNHQSQKSDSSQDQDDVVDLDQEDRILLDQQLPDDEILEEEESPTEKIIPEELEVPELEISEPVGRLEPKDPFLEIIPAAFETEDSAGSQPVFIPDPALFEADIEIEQQLDAEEFAQELFDEVEELLDAEVAVFDEETSTADRQAERLVVTQLLSNGNAKTTPQSLLTVVEARDTYDEPVDLDGEISLMVMTADPNAPQRLHRWDFTKDETISAWQSSELGDGLHMELPLAETQLPSTPLELWVRLIRPDGSKLLTQYSFALQELLPIDHQGPAVALDSDTSSEEETGLKRLQPVSQAESDTMALQPAPTTSKSQKGKPRWRASMQRTNALLENYSSTASGVSRWTAQSGSRLPQQPASSVQKSDPNRAVQTKTGSGEHSGKQTTMESPQWKPFR